MGGRGASNGGRNAGAVLPNSGARTLRADEATRIKDEWSGYDKTVAESQLENYGKIYLDSFGAPIDNEFEAEERFKSDIGRQYKNAKVIIAEVNGTKLEYSEIGGKLYNTTDVTPEPIRTDDKKLSDVVYRIKSNNPKVKITKLTSADVKKRDALRAKQKAETDRILDDAYVRDKTFVKTSRENRIRNRVTRRGAR